MIERTYLDWNATAPLRPRARAAVVAALDALGNPSSVHREGRAVRHLIEQAREQVAALVGAEPRNVVFTSGATEANMLALTPAFEAAKDKPRRCERLLVSAIEHPSVRGGGRFPAARVDEFGVTRGRRRRSFRPAAAADRVRTAGRAIAAGLGHGGQQRDRGGAADQADRGHGA